MTDEGRAVDLKGTFLGLRIHGGHLSTSVKIKVLQILNFEVAYASSCNYIIIRIRYVALKV